MKPLLVLVAFLYPATCSWNIGCKVLVILARLGGVVCRLKPFKNLVNCFFRLWEEPFCVEVSEVFLLEHYKVLVILGHRVEVVT
ncbi:hypothetical protein BGZ60DRAFT_420802 [Tricladium varicosporioides]|nr:hypothetical protein BGZ60DRAFT_420802 [Hymenoscyphus varicosporioides]